MFHASKASKLAFLVTSFMAYICFAYYTADLTSLMATKATIKAVSSFSEAVEQDFRFVLWGGSKAEDHLKNAPAGSGRKLAYDKVRIHLTKTSSQMTIIIMISEYLSLGLHF